MGFKSQVCGSNGTSSTVQRSDGTTGSTERIAVFLVSQCQHTLCQHSTLVGTNMLRYPYPRALDAIALQPPHAANRRDADCGTFGGDCLGRQIGLLCFVHSSVSETITNPTLKYRKLRIAFSAVCGIICLLLIALWVRSYYVPGRIVIVRSPVGTIMAYSAAGHLITTATTSALQAKPLGVWPQGDGNTRISDPPLDFIIYPDFGFAAVSLTNTSALELPYWFSVAVLAALSALPWLRSRFSLRTLLIGMTLVAVLLGAAVWTVK